jgi:tetratricopeptide (TPR) repeat protein
LVAAGIGFVFLKRGHALTEKDSILITDFVNTTADPVFDGTLKKALAVDLEQSPYLNVFPDQKIRQTLQFMGRSPGDRITTDVGREICQRDGIKAMLNGSIDSVGGQYVVTLEATNASSGDSLGRQQAQADRKEDVLNALHGAATKLRGQLGESLSMVQKYDMSLSMATTSSLDALKALSLGDAKHNMGDELAALPNYQHAIELDPNFAMAYARLGTNYSNLGQTELSEQNRQKAFELRDRASEREKLYIMSHYYADSGQLDKGITAYELYRQTYPRDATPFGNLAGIYNNLGQFDNALENAKRAVEIDPDMVVGYDECRPSLCRIEPGRGSTRHHQRRAPAQGIHYPFPSGAGRIGLGRRQRRRHGEGIAKQPRRPPTESWPFWIFASTSPAPMGKCARRGNSPARPKKRWIACTCKVEPIWRRGLPAWRRWWAIARQPTAGRARRCVYPELFR